jgi:hypothetical protein
MKPEVTKCGVFDMQVCVPTEWTDSQVLSFAEKENPSGTNGWFIRRQGDEALGEDGERVTCGGRSGYVHIMLDA